MKNAGISRGFPEFAVVTSPETSQRILFRIISLNTLKRKIEGKSDEPNPSFMMILTAVGPSYRREDGIYTVPIGKLKA